MALSSVKASSKSSNLSIKRVWSKLRSKEKSKKCNENEFVLDSSPDYFYEEKSVEDSSQHLDQSKDSCNEGTSTTKNKQKNITTDEKSGKSKTILGREKENEIPRSQKTKETKHKSSEENSSAQITYNLNVDHGSVHIGDVKNVTQSYFIQQTYSNGIPEKVTKSKDHTKRPAKINAIFESTEKLESAHSEFLSNHFGRSYREIGLKLGISSGQIDLVENDFGNNMKDVSFELLNLWMRKNGSEATIGKLCVTLWKSKIPHAKEAVKQLADNIHNFD